MQLEGKRVLITGAGSGIGRALAIEASRLGMSVALCGRRSEALEATLMQLAPNKGHLCLAGDVTDPALRQAVRDYLHRHWGDLDVLINNAGLLSIGPIRNTTDANLEQMMSINVVAPIALTREILPLLRNAKGARVVNVGSMFGDIPYPLFAAYCASKFALRGLSSAMRRELRGDGIGVTYASPRGARTHAAEALEPLREALQMTLDDPAVVARRIWRAVKANRDNVYAKGPERFFVLVQRLFPGLVDRSIAKQMMDPRVQRVLQGESRPAPKPALGPSAVHDGDRAGVPSLRSIGRR